jgi:hypothetical protein
LSYEALISSSNVAFDANDPQHRFDYGDRNFVEHLVELGLELRHRLGAGPAQPLNCCA